MVYNAHIRTHIIKDSKMAQVTIYMDNNLEEKVKKMAQATGVSISKFIATILEQKVKTNWDESIKELSGSWNGEDVLNERNSTYNTADIQREGL